ncbi:hypothetical protein N7534_005617 [Penicillium rubens]|nr:hypothetical protein N7534_005617 [Penicillium rubens]
MKFLALPTFALFLQGLASPTGDLMERATGGLCEHNYLHCGSVMRTYSNIRPESLVVFKCGGITGQCDIDRSLYKCGEWIRECKHACVPTPPGQNDYCASSLYEPDGRPDELLENCVKREYDGAARAAEKATTPLKQKDLEVMIDRGLYSCVNSRSHTLFTIPGQDPNHKKQLDEVKKELKAKWDKSQKDYDEMKKEEDEKKRKENGGKA